MSRSYRKPYCSILGLRSMKRWRTQENRRLRHNTKQLINNCLDYDALIIPVLNDYDTLYGSPRDGRNRYQKKPLLNQCEVDFEKVKQRIYVWYEHSPEDIAEAIKRNEKDYIHGGKHCECYSNKRHAWYWKVRRK